jgi:prepilin-type N-terminal cleavage/methylation domain-containing protein
MRNRLQMDGGFTLVEILVSTAIIAVAFAVLLQAAAAGQRTARAQPEAAEEQQRVRVAAGMIGRDLMMAGSGLTHGNPIGSLANYMPGILPARTGSRLADPELTFFSDRISIFYVAQGTSAGAALIENMAGPGSAVAIDPNGPGCPGAGECGFSAGTRAVVFDLAEAGSGFDLFSVTGTTAGLEHAAPNPPFSRTYLTPSAFVVPIVQRVYYLDPAGRRLMLYDGHVSDTPLVDNVVDLRFSYYIDPSARAAPTPNGAGGNCVFAAGSPPVPLLADFGGMVARPAGPTDFTDGPACGIAPNRFDGDLLRIRRIRVTIRVQTGLDDLRGTGPQFRVPGVSVSGESYVPDLEVSFDVAPRNLVAGR